MAAAGESAWARWLSDPAHKWDHRVSGVHAALSLTGALPAAFRDFYFGWLDRHALPGAGFSSPCLGVAPNATDRRADGPASRGATEGGFGGAAGSPARADAARPVNVSEMTCWAHVGWQYAWQGRRWPHASLMVDATLAMQNNETGYFNINSDGSAEAQQTASASASPVLPSCHQLDAVWTLTRSSKQSGGHRWDDVRDACRRFVHAAAAVLNDPARILPPSPLYADSHGLNGALEAIAECASHFPGLVRTRRPWVASLDAAPFM